MESSSIDSHHDPRIWEEQVWLLEGFDVFISIDVSKKIKEGRECVYLELAILGQWNW